MGACLLLFCSQAKVFLRCTIPRRSLSYATPPPELPNPLFPVRSRPGHPVFLQRPCYRPARAGGLRLSGYRQTCHGPGGRSGGPDESGGEGLPDAEPCRSHPRLGIPEYDWWSEGTAWDRALRLRYGLSPGDRDGRHMGRAADAPRGGDDLHRGAAKNTEALRQGIHSIYFGVDLWSPNINIFRDPRWGRGQETYGEDPYLTSRMGVAFVTGLQATMSATTAPFRRRSTLPCTPARRARGTAPISTHRPTISKTPTCRHSAHGYRGPCAA